MKRTRIMYIEQKAGALTGPAWIGRVRFSKTGKMLAPRAARERASKARDGAKESLAVQALLLLPLRRSQSCRDTFLNDASLKLGDSHEDIELELTRRVQP